GDARARQSQRPCRDALHDGEPRRRRDRFLPVGPRSPDRPRRPHDAREILRGSLGARPGLSRRQRVDHLGDPHAGGPRRQPLARQAGPRTDLAAPPDLARIGAKPAYLPWRTSRGIKYGPTGRQLDDFDRHREALTVIRVAIADDHPIFREALRLAMALDPEI